MGWTQSITSNALRGTAARNLCAAMGSVATLCLTTLPVAADTVRAWTALADACAVTQDVAALRSTALQAGWSELDLGSPHFDAALTLFSHQALLANPFINPAHLSAEDVAEKAEVKRSVLMNTFVQNMGTGRMGFLTLDLPDATAFVSYRNEGPGQMTQDAPCTVYVLGRLPATIPAGLSATQPSAPPAFTIPDVIIELSPTS